MTCIVGIADGEKVWMGADSMASSGYRKSTYAEGKMWRTGELLFGGCGSLRGLQVIRHFLETAPVRLEGQTDDQYLVQSLMPAIAEVMDDHGLRSKKGFMRDVGGLLVGYHGELYSIGQDFCVMVMSDRYGAEGSGEEFALGSLHSSTGTPRQRLTKALEAAAYHELHVAPPFIILTV